LDRYISYALTEYLIHQFTEQAKKCLMSKNALKIEEGARDVELLDERTLANSPYYRAYKSILRAIIGEGPVMHLHLKAVEMVAMLSLDLQSKHRCSSVADVVLNKCKLEVELFSVIDITSDKKEVMAA
jgi:hypothetical protein